MSGRLVLVPNLLGAVAPERVLPAHTLAVARELRDWVVESPKPARAFLKSLDATRAVASLSIVAIGEDRTPAPMKALLEPARQGRDLGLLSDAGCPGVADPGAALVAAAHAEGLRVVPLVGPSSILLALMASGMNGQQFCFHGYLPADAPGRIAALRQLEADSRTRGLTQIAIETPYRNAALLDAMLATLAPATRLCVAADLTLSSETIISKRVRDWPRAQGERYAKRPAIFLFESAR